MNKVLTIVVPSYNVEAYLKGTLNSFVEPEILEDIEVLVVNDGSKDRTPEIAESFEKKYPGTFRLISKENGGHGSTINRGIEEASGRYFKVVDGDDWVDTKDFTRMVHRLKTAESDYVVTNYYKVNDVTKEKTPEEFPYFREHPICSFDEAAGQSEIPMHALVIRTAILKENQIRLDERCFYVDNEYITFPIPYVETVEYYDLFVYMYRLAVAAQSVSMKGFQKHLPDHVKVTKRLVDFSEEYTAALKKQLRVKDTSEEANRQEGAGGGKWLLSKEKARYLRNQAAIMVGDQAGIYASFPLSNRDIRLQFIAFDQEIKEKSPAIYRLSDGKSRMLHALRKNHFKRYWFWTTLSKLKLRMRQS